MKVFDASRPDEVRHWLHSGFEKAADRAMVATALRLVSHIQNEVIPKEDPKPVDRGVYRAGWRSKQVSRGAEVFNTVAWASIIEFGVRAGNVKIGRAMIDALSKWVERKGIAGKADSRGVAFAIANSMKKKGIFNRGGRNGLRVLEKALTRLGEFATAEFIVEVRREFEKS